MDSVRPVEPGDIDAVARGMRVSDVLTLASLHPEYTPRDVLIMAVDMSTLVWTFLHKGEPIAIYGAAPLSLLSDTASPWLLATDAAFTRSRALVRDGKEYSRRMLAQYPHLSNYVDARDHRAVRWLAHIGYDLQPAAPYGPLRAPFRQFEMRA